MLILGVLRTEWVDFWVLISEDLKSRFGDDCSFGSFDSWKEYSDNLIEQNFLGYSHVKIGFWKFIV
jgi:hypothetical protein